MKLGFFILLFTATVISFSVMSIDSAYAGCAGDCMTCHPELIGDIDHLSLATCIKCHEPVKDKAFSLSSGGCGERCFQCHTEYPKDSSHASLDTCLECHEK